MSIEANKAVVKQYFARFTDGSGKDPYENFAPEATWWMAGGRAARSSKRFAGFWNGMEEVREMSKNVKSVFRNVEAVEIKGITAEGDRVAVELEARVYTRAGELYNNQYHYLFEVRDGKIRAVREYFDTALVAEKLG
jgi:uncharacterized protein